MNALWLCSLLEYLLGLWDRLRRAIRPDSYRRWKRHWIVMCLLLFHYVKRFADKRGYLWLWCWCCNVVVVAECDCGCLFYVACLSCLWRHSEGGRSPRQLVWAKLCNVQVCQRKKLFQCCATFIIIIIIINSITLLLFVVRVFVGRGRQFGRARTNLVGFWCYVMSEICNVSSCFFYLAKHS